MNRRFVRGALVAGAASLLASAAAEAQPLGTFTWQLQPFCNVVTVNLTQQGAVYTMDGFDDQCGAPQRAALVGLATPNGDGSIQVGLNLVTAPGGRGVQVAARFTLPSASGTWSDSAGNAGTFAFGASTGGSTARTHGARFGDCAGIDLGAAPHARHGGGRADRSWPGTGPGGRHLPAWQALRGVNPDGTVICTDALTVVDTATGNAGNFSAIAIGVDGLSVVSYRDLNVGGLGVTRTRVLAPSA